MPAASPPLVSTANSSALRCPQHGGLRDLCRCDSPIGMRAADASRKRVDAAASSSITDLQRPIRSRRSRRGRYPSSRNLRPDVSTSSKCDIPSNSPPPPFGRVAIQAGTQTRRHVRARRGTRRGASGAPWVPSICLSEAPHPSDPRPCRLRPGRWWCSIMRRFVR